MPASLATLQRALVYLDRDFIADQYEVASGEPAAATLVRTRSPQPGGGLLPFSAEVGAQEARSHPLSTLQMLGRTWPHLAGQPALNPREYAERSLTEYGWVQATLTTFQVRLRSSRDGQDTAATAQSSHFQLHGESLGRHVNLVTTPDAFAPGFQALLPLQMTLLNKFALPVCAYLRLLPAKDHAENWIAVPLVVLEAQPALVRDMAALA
ncbi:hypothetical protein SAMN05428957_104190 [Oryzisolibacter propanilivorax]|uniref:Uncharacterized protein n=1 Tax=Oryzisolibacter propanilivorax TaxID=1527607 RepID=A0A1G9S995_9BURK|nr:hypothetical protein [Oryzisolibacter propanilivorax]SDM31910.1 hypothetical protein SAMN05428957_104190 [Oryzisolibacter propanilivorax]